MLLSLLPTLALAQVDMGLPSGLQWGQHNLGAKYEDPFGAGDDYCWGALKPAPWGCSEYAYKYLGYDRISSDLTMEQDAVHKYHPNVFGIMRMPTKEDYQELIDNCPYIWIDNYKDSGMPGLLFLSRKTGQTLFFPAVKEEDEIKLGYYWTSSYKDEKNAYYFAFTSKGARLLAEIMPRYTGMQIKEVYDYSRYTQMRLETKTHPEFPNGGFPALVKYIASNLKYPKDAAEKNIQGKVILEFVIGEDGTITNIEILKSAHPSLDAEAIRVISSMPKWIPAKREGYEIADKYCLPVTFRIN